ncbi:MAG: hypothetical protein E7638_06765 [Ruminococcaceae bacterium]|nr:hypothetical protein [Oscillospiraceae bacterium]
MSEERNEEMSLREALEGAFAEESAQDGGTATAETPAAAETEAEQAVEEQAAESPALPPREPVDGVTEGAPQQTGGMPTPSEMWQAMQGLMQENRRLAAEIRQRDEAIMQQSEAAEGAIMGQFTPEAAVPAQTPPAMSAPPVLNMSEFNYLDPEKQQEMLAKWQQESMNYAVRSAAAQVKEEILKDIAPVREDYEAKRRVAANDAAKVAIFAMPQFADMKGKEDEIERVIAGTPLLQNAAPEERYMLGALISRGLHAAKQPTSEELINMAKANPDVMKALEAARVAEIQQNNAALPRVVPSSGMGNANAVPENKPKTMDDVKKAFHRLYK